MWTFTNTCDGTQGSHYTLTMTVEQLSTSISGNYSTVRVIVTRTRESSSYYNYGYDNHCGIWLDGEVVAQADPVSAHNKYATQEMIRWEDRIYHNSDGTKTVNFMFSFSSTSSTLSGGSVEGDVTLNTIPRATPSTSISGAVGATVVAHIVPYYTGFRHLLRITLGSTTQDETFDVGVVDKAFTISTDFYKEITGSYATGTVTVYTYDGDNYIGSDSSGSALISINQSENTPTLSLTLVDSNPTTVALTGSSSKIIQGYSTGTITSTYEAKNGATVSSLSLKYGEETTNVTEAEGKTSGTSTTTITNLAVAQITGTITDSRGLSYIGTTSGNSIVSYTPLDINVTFARPSSTSDRMYYSLNGVYWSGDFGASSNTLTLQWRVREGYGNWSSWQSFTYTLYGSDTTKQVLSGSNSTTPQNVYISNPNGTSWKYNEEYTFQVQMVDRLVDYSGENVKIIVVGGGLPIYNWYVRNKKNYFNVNGSLLMNGEELYPVGAIKIFYDNKDHSNYLGYTWERIGGGRMPIGYTTSDSDFNSIGKTGGEKTHTITVDEMPPHKHTGNTNTDGHHKHQIAYNDSTATQPSNNDKISLAGWDTHYSLNEWLTYSEGNFSAHSHAFTTDNTGGGNAHNNMPPYIVFAFWVRVQNEPDYSVSNPVSSNPYYFAINSNGYYESNNKGVSNSYALAKVDIYTPTSTTVTVTFINYGESSYDFGLLSTLDHTLSSSNTADTANVAWNGSGQQSASPQTYTYSVSTGSHYFYVKYKKDSSVDNGNDSFQFKITIN